MVKYLYQRAFLKGFRIPVSLFIPVKLKGGVNMNWPFVIWASVFILCIIIEMLTLGLTTIWFSGGAIVAAIMSLFDCSATSEIIVFALVSFALLFTTRPIAKKHLSPHLEKTNVESYVGEKVIVTEAIDNLNFAGQVKINGVEWTARSINDEIIPVGTEVVIRQVSGVKLIVSRTDENQNYN